MPEQTIPKVRNKRARPRGAQRQAVQDADEKATAAAREAHDVPGVTEPHGLPSQQDRADQPHTAGIPTDADSIARARGDMGLQPQPVALRLRANASVEERRAFEQAVAREVDQIAMLFSRGNNEFEIRAQLGLSRRGFEHRLRRLKRATLDSQIVWTKFASSSSQDLKRLYYIYSKAIRDAKPRYSTALDAIRAMHDVRKSIIEVGQSLGVYERTVDDFGLSWPEITMSLLMGGNTNAGALPVGNIHNNPPANLLLTPDGMDGAEDADIVIDGEAGDVPTDDEMMASGAGGA